MTKNLDLLWRDEHLVAVHKPSGISVHRGWDRQGPFALQLTRDQTGRRVYPVHRLDRPTSGVLLFAFSGEVAAAVQEQLKAGEVVKRYLALVRGIPGERGTVDHPLTRSGQAKEKVPAVTDYCRLGIFRRYSLLLARPRTGRLHQIRRHMKHISCPLIGDVRYGKGEHNRWFREHFGLHRLALHALSLELRHPFTGEPLRPWAPPDADLEEPLSAMGLDRRLWSQGRSSSGWTVGSGTPTTISSSESSSD